MKITLCSRPNACCPTVETTEYGFTVKDDFGGSVKLTKEQMRILKEKVE